MTHHLAQVNISRLAAPIDSAQLADFVSALRPINRAANLATGFIWQPGEEGAITLDAFADDVGDGAGIVTNLSVWRDVESLKAYVYGTAHGPVLRRRREWFLPIAEAYAACWWVPRGHRPTVVEAQDRVARLRADGPTAYAFTLKDPVPPPD
ncbi:DUF3291 domain-containing protein [Luteipulveratus halotolerans]|uniref:DUF3291 domain-containing protein n=1 Tax=Luteipulveratus halotolerans TaxID=1631356 RepID=A0A0L6CL03_9MICO|nr:DUF3291 domain-containing protein [Luteipulveratus halotolerans]KNX38409.1 hypothetical protein VV01_16675 [Luteipulveratus halotolerans]